MKRIAALTALAFTLAATLSAADNSPDLTMQTRIRQEGLRNSKVMELASGLMDGIGARLTGSPNMKRANEWTRDKLTELGMSNAHLESWGPFGRGWSYELCSVRMTSPDAVQLYAIPKAWSPGTAAPVHGKPVKVKLETKDDLEKQKGKLAGKIVMLGEPREIKVHDKVQFSRYDEKELETLSQYEISARPRFTREEYLKRRGFRRQLAQFLQDEKVAVAIEPGSGDGGTFNVQASGSQKPEDPAGVPTVTLSPEHYARLSRLMEAGKEVELDVDLHTTFYQPDPNAWNTIAEIPGSDKKGEVVMLGAHLDSWHSGTGATDNGAGVVAMMEAMRILKTIGIVPRRTIRIALWSGEEQGLLGSHAYVAEHFGARVDPKDAEEKELPFSMRKEKTPLALKPEHARLSAYFNLDNGTGKIRGIYAQENAAARPIFEAWLAPLHDLGATNVTMRNTGSTDHISFDEVGLPGFQFIQDTIEYDTRTHHTNYDTYERLQPEDLMQAATVIASFVWETANRPDLLPRKPLSQTDLGPATTAAPH
jgi:carboxypeptidase Q